MYGCTDEHFYLYLFIQFKNISGDLLLRKRLPGLLLLGLHSPSAPASHGGSRKLLVTGPNLTRHDSEVKNKIMSKSLHC